MAKLQKVESDSPERCQGVFSGGQCPYKRHEQSQFCLMHGGNRAGVEAKRRAVHDYQIQTYQERLDNLAGSANVKNLRGEIGILRIAMENTLAQVKTPNQFPIYADKLQSLARDLKGLVEVCQKIEERNKELLSKTEVFNIADAVISVVSDYITDPDQLLEVGELLHAVIIGAASGENSIGTQPKVDNPSKPVGDQV